MSEDLGKRYGGIWSATNGIQVGDTVQIVGTQVIGKVTGIDYHPFEWAQLRIEYESAAGHVSCWQSARNASIQEKANTMELPAGVYLSEGLLTLTLKDGSRAFYKDGKLYIKSEQLDTKLVLIQAEASNQDYEFTGTGPA
jgi:hypothetical protein